MARTKTTVNNFARKLVLGKRAKTNRKTMSAGSRSRQKALRGMVVRRTSARLRARASRPKKFWAGRKSSGDSTKKFWAGRKKGGKRTTKKKSKCGPGKTHVKGYCRKTRKK